MKAVLTHLLFVVARASDAVWRAADAYARNQHAQAATSEHSLKERIAALEESREAARIHDETKLRKEKL